MQQVVSATEAREQFEYLLDQVTERNEQIIVDRGDKPKAILISLDEYKRLKGHAPQQENWRELVDKAHAMIRKDTEGLPPLDVDKLIHEMREERDAQFLENLRRR